MVNGLYQHFYPQERAFIDRVSDWIDKVTLQGRSQLTPFLNPRELFILKSLLGRVEGVQLRTAPKRTEYVRALLAPDYYELKESDFEMALLELDYPAKFRYLTHSQVLGALLGETGVDRRELGDILVVDGRVQFYINQKLLPYLEEQVKKIGGLPVAFRPVHPQEVLTVEANETVSLIQVSSLRLDKILAASLKNTRNFAINMIESSRVKVNYVAVDQKDWKLSLGDLVSVRGYGRIRLLNYLGETKKGKQKIEISTLTNHRSEVEQ